MVYGHPERVLVVCEDIVHDRTFAVGLLRQFRQFDLLDPPAGKVVQIESVGEGRNPQPIRLVGRQRHNGFVFHPRPQMVVVVELRLVVVVHGIALIQRSDPQVFVRIGEDPADLELRRLERESGFALMNRRAGHEIIEEHSVPRRVEQQPVGSERMNIVDLRLAERRVPDERVGNRDEPVRIRIEKGDRAVARQPQVAVLLQEGVVRIVFDRNAFLELHGLRIVTAYFQRVDDPQVVVAVDMAPVVERALRIEIGDHAFEASGRRVVGVELDDRVEQDAPAAAFDELVAVLVMVVDGNAAEIVLLGILAYAVDGGDPQPVLRVAEEILDVVVGQSRIVVRAEILVEVLGVVLVQSAEGGDPDMSLRIFGEGVDRLIGDVAGYGRVLRFFLPLVRSDGRPARCCEQKCRKQNGAFFHRFRVSGRSGFSRPAFPFLQV